MPFCALLVVPLYWYDFSLSFSLLSAFQKRSFLHFDYLLLSLFPIETRKHGGSSDIAATFLEGRDFSLLPIPVLLSTNIHAHYILFHQICDRTNKRAWKERADTFEGWIKDMAKIRRIYRMSYNIVSSCSLTTCIAQFETHVSNISSRHWKQVCLDVIISRRKIIFK